MKKKEIRKIARTGEYSYYVTLPKDYIDELNWRKGQKVTVKKVGKRLIIEDWDKI